MTDYRFHWWASGTRPAQAPSVSLSAESPLSGAALALRHFVEQDYDITAPLAHLDVIEAEGVKHTLLVEEVLDWLQEPQQVEFVARERLRGLLR